MGITQTNNLTSAKQLMRASMPTPVGRPPRMPVAGQPKLSRRELEVMLMICDDKSEKQIANDLFLSARTVNQHVSNIYFKLGVHTRLSLYKHALSANIISPPEQAIPIKVVGSSISQ